MAKYGVILKAEINRLARLYYKMMGCNVEEGYDFSKARHPTERMVWQQAEISMMFWQARFGAQEPVKPAKKLSRAAESIGKKQTGDDNG